MSDKSSMIRCARSMWYRIRGCSERAQQTSRPTPLLDPLRARLLDLPSSARDNALLAALPEAAYCRLLPDLEATTLRVGDVLFRRTGRPSFAYFPTRSSLVAVCRGHSRRNGHGMARGSRRDGGDLAVFRCPKAGLPGGRANGRDCLSPARTGVAGGVPTGECTATSAAALRVCADHTGIATRCLQPLPLGRAAAVPILIAGFRTCRRRTDRPHTGAYRGVAGRAARIYHARRDVSAERRSDRICARPRHTARSKQARGALGRLRRHYRARVCRGDRLMFDAVQIMARPAYLIGRRAVSRSEGCNDSKRSSYPRRSGGCRDHSRGVAEFGRRAISSRLGTTLLRGPGTIETREAAGATNGPSHGGNPRGPPPAG